MPEGRPFPYNFIPRPGATLSVTFGKPVPSQEIQDALAATVEKTRAPEASSTPPQELRSALVAERGWLGDPVQLTSDVAALEEEEAIRRAIEVGRVRSAVTALIQRKVEALGRQVLGIQ